MNGRLMAEIEIWIERSVARLREDQLEAVDFEILRRLVAAHAPTTARQHILYLYARDPILHSEVVGWYDPRDPDPPAKAPPRPYPTVAAALADGWRVIQFPLPQDTGDRTWTGLVGAEFILHKQEL